MPFNISNFKSTIDKYGGPARSSLYEVTINKAREENSVLEPQTEFQFFCQRVNFPGIQIENGSMAAVSQLPTSFPLTMTSAPITLTFMVDSDHQILSFFHNWIQKVLNYSTKGGTFASIGEAGTNGQLPYELGYKDEYACRMSVKHYSTEIIDDKYYEVILDNIYPYSISDLDLAWAESDSVLTVTVTFAYDRIWYSSDKIGIPSQRTNGGTLERLSDLAGLVDVPKQTKDSRRPRSIQDAVNRLNRARNSYENLRRFFSG